MIQVVGFRFRAGLVPTLATVLLFPVLLSLGFWQLDRAEQKEGILAAYDAMEQAPALDLNRDTVDADEHWYRRAVAHGEFDDRRQFLLDNQTHQRTVGYHVLTPMRLEGRDEAVLVDRGWVPLGDSRDRLPPVTVAAQLTELRGHLDQGPPTGIRLGGMADGEQGWPLRIQYIDYAALESHLGYQLLPVVLRMDSALPGGYVREWRPQHPTGFGPERNRGYAVQWFALAAALLIIYLAVNIKRVRREQHD
ncbi:MAG: SURF1 family protein [Ectothiorhodospiraceae bacterium]|nr:SURF1 family protein [Ectothiorhodospiraceae bacterium]MCH8504792.1 SURF1 family protein [Ectothiorhodospiraceae bacterium]